ncbi:MAG: TIGR03905 family TSCPD domain-containing protein [Firmicutes bacterium]|nr:TIGR03905 family TSCPD domain-containing protein [Bacillota bacterium]
MKHSYKTKGTCAVKINFNLDGNIIKDISFEGGCNGNLKAVASLADGMTIEQLENKCKGIVCGFRSTSCADQLTIAARQAFENK